MNSLSPGLKLSAYFLGRRIAGQRKRAPVAYLFNGVRLPVLPEWDRGKYPFAFIVITKSILTGNREAATLYVATNVTDTFTIGPGFMHTKIYLDDLTTGWGEFSVSDIQNYMSYTNVKWTNFDLYNGESIYMAASDPVPVYE